MYAFIVWIAFIWFFVLFCDTIFKTCMFHPYFRALRVTGLDIKPLFVYLRVTRHNRIINQMGRWRPLLLQRWFDVGAFVTCIIVIPCLTLYFVSLYQMMKSSSIDDYDSSVLLPVIPGYNFPLSHWGYYIIIILLSSTIHEFGHALAASRERISIEDWGFALCAVFPLAFVHLRFDQFRQISLWQQLRILCAGIWHNIVLSFAAFILWSCLYILLSPLYFTGSGVSVISIHQLSALNHPAGFEVKDHIYSIGNCSVNDVESWRECLKDFSSKNQLGFCIPETYFLENTYSKNLESCVNSSGHLYFVASEFQNKGVCLNARQTFQDYNQCGQTLECKTARICVFPVLTSKSHRLVAVKRHHKPPVLFEGSLAELSADVQVSAFISKYKIFPASIAESILTLLEYLIIFSSGLACLNILPIFSLDGQFIIENLIHLCLPNYITSHEHRRLLFLFIQRVAFLVAFGLILTTVYKIYTLF